MYVHTVVPSFFTCSYLAQMQFCPHSAPHSPSPGPETPTYFLSLGFGLLLASLISGLMIAVLLSLVPSIQQISSKFTLMEHVSEYI